MRPLPLSLAGLLLLAIYPKVGEAATFDGNGPSVTTNAPTLTRSQNPTMVSAFGTELVLVGDAQWLNQATIRLTQAVENQVGGIWLQAPTSLTQGFVVDFQFQITGLGGYPIDWDAAYPQTGGDGLAFVVQNASRTALGLYASGIGYYGIPNSLAVVFGTWNNKPSYCEPSGSHVAINSMGRAENRPEHCASNAPGNDGSDGTFANPTLAIAPVPSRFDEGKIHSARITYANRQMEVFLDGKRLLSTSVDLSQLLALDAQGRAYLGFTSSTGGAWENHDLLQLSVQEIPEPSTEFLVGAALVAGSLLLRRRG